MPTFKFEAMDTSGDEVKDSVEATNEEEAQQKIKPDGLLRHQAHGDGRRQGGKKGKKKKAGKPQEARSFTIGGVSQQAARAPSPASSRRSRTPACRCCGACGSSNGR